MYSDGPVQALVFDMDLLVRLGRRGYTAAAAGAMTFEMSECAAVAEAIAADVRVERARARAERWSSDGASYHELVRLSADFVLELEALGPAGEPVYVPKVRDELEPLLALWPHVLTLPTNDELSMRDLLRLRAFPVHPLGVKSAAAWADGRQCSPAEFFFHDLDHARFKVREDLLALGIPITDAYQNGTTLDPISGRDRSILPEAFGKIGASLWSLASERSSLIENLLAHITALNHDALAAAAEWLLFQILHEKSFPLDVPTLGRELSVPRHVELLRTKVERGFYAMNAPSSDAMAQLDKARHWLLELLI